MAIKTITSKIAERKEIIKGTSEVVFDIAGQDFHFKAGQYVKITIPDMLHEDPKGNFRLFSVASSPNQKDSIEIVFRDSDSGFKKTLREASIGHKIEIEGPYGLFTLPDDQKEPIVFVAGGIGIAPCLSMIRFATEENLEHPITLIYSNNSLDSAAYLEEIERLKAANPHFAYCNNIGYINAECITETIIDVMRPIWYVVGPPKMVEVARGFLAQLGINESKIRYERFTGI